VPEGFTAYDLDGKQLDSIPLGSNGQGIAIVETKTGKATLSGNQSVGYPEVVDGTVTGVGANARDANLGGIVPADTPVVVLTPE
jgi:myo-inositol-hexaphosphate 3-phosphohydrolase